MIEFTEVIKASDVTESDIKALTTIHLGIDSRIKSRIRVTLDNGSEAGLYLPRGQTLRDGDVLVSTCGQQVRVIAAKEKVSTVTRRRETLRRIYKQLITVTNECFDLMKFQDRTDFEIR